MNAHKKSTRAKASGKKQKSDRKKDLKEKTVAAEMGAAEMGATVLREEAMKPAPQPAPVAVNETQATTKTPEKRSDAVAPGKAKPSATTPEPRPAMPGLSEANKSKPSPEPRPTPRPQVVTKPLPEPRPEPQTETADSAVAALERTFKAAGRCTVAVNCKLLDFARANVTCSLDHVKDLAAARSPARIMQLQMAFWHDCLANFASQADELRALSLDLVANANEPIREHMRRSLKGKAV